MLALARKIVNGDEDEAETVEAVFAHARDAEAAAEEYLVDEGWQAVKAEPVAVEVGRHEDALEDDAVVSGCDGNEPQPSLFSWAEFLAQEQGRRRSRRPKPASTSLFEWAFSLEREREAELVGAGR